MDDPTPILLSGPDVGPAERKALLAAFDSGWIAPVGPDLAAFEEAVCDETGAPACVALSSGSAALHLALLLVGVRPGDEVLVQSATFAASAFSVVHAGATPVFVDSDRSTWCMDPDLLEAELASRAESGRLPAAVMPVDLYGSLADYERITAICDHHGVPIVQDAAEALGSRSATGTPASLGHLAALSFNGNKVMTTSGGGALVGPADLIDRARHLATQAREPALHYEHVEIGFNYRMSNLLAALGRAQLERLDEIIGRCGNIAARYQDGLPDLEWCPYAATSRPNHWLSVGLLPDGLDPAALCRALNDQAIEARPFWKPMHRQPVFATNSVVGGETSDEFYRRGVCLPSGSALRDDEIDRVIGAVDAWLERQGSQ